jgi:type I site-specific restriction-modification system R (restriction) subunit
MGTFRSPRTPTSSPTCAANSSAQQGVTFSDAEWERFFSTCIAGANDGILEKTARIQEDHVQVLKRDDGTTKNIYLIDKANIHNNALQVINQYEVEGARANRYDVTVLVNGLPMVHIELKRRGVDIREAFNQINRYQRDSFWAGLGPVRVRAAVRHQQRHADQVLQQHRARRASEEQSGKAQQEQDLQQLFLHQLVGRREEPAHHRADRLHQDLLRQAHAAEHPHQATACSMWTASCW